MTRSYVSYGLHLLADGDVPGLARSRCSHPPDVRLRLNALPATLRASGRSGWYQSDRPGPDGQPKLVIWRTKPDGGFHFVYADGTEFLIRPDGAEVWAHWPEAATVADAAVYLRGPVLGLVLRLKGIVGLHASAIAIGDSAVAILGSAGAGKSTTAAAFVQRGFSALADDMAALRVEGDGLFVMPGYPRLNLWPDAGEALYGSAEQLPRVTPPDGINDWWDKRYLDLERDDEYHSRPLRLAAVYVLGDRAATDAPRIEALSAHDAFLALVDGTYVNYALDQSMRAAEFHLLARLVKTAPVRLVIPPATPARLAELCDAILDDWSTIGSQAASRRRA